MRLYLSGLLVLVTLVGCGGQATSSGGVDEMIGEVVFVNDSGNDLRGIEIRWAGNSLSMALVASRLRKEMAFVDLAQIKSGVITYSDREAGITEGRCSYTLDPAIKDQRDVRMVRFIYSGDNAWRIELYDSKEVLVKTVECQLEEPN